MEKIELLHTLPQIFKENDRIESEIWHREIILNKGNTYLIEAASGTGKTSLFSYVYGCREDYEGIICFDGTNIRNFAAKEWMSLRRCSLSMLFQELRLFPELSAKENTLLKNRLTGYKPWKEIESWFECLGIADKINTPVGCMSLGQQQRVAFIRALCQPFDFLLLDEPVSHVDEANARIMAELLTNELTHRGAGVLVTSIGKHLPLSYSLVYKL